MKAAKMLAVLLAMSVGLNAYQFFKQAELPTGGGIAAASHDGSMEALLSDLKPSNPLSSDRDTYGQLVIKDADDEWFTLRFSPTGLEGSGAYRGGATLTWSPDSRFVEARAPFVLVKVDAKRLRERQLHPSPVLEPPIQDSTTQ